MVNLNKYIEMVCIIDNSGSMESNKESAINSFNTFLKSQKDLGSDTGAVLTLVFFNSSSQMVYNAIDINRVPELNWNTYQCDGMTALYDAVGGTIDTIGKRLANTPDALRPAKVIVTILTDGLENASRRYSKHQIEEMIKHQESKYSWEFVYLSSDIKAKEHASSIGINRGIFYDIKRGMGDAYRSMTATYSSSRIDLDKH